MPASATIGKLVLFAFLPMTMLESYGKTQTLLNKTADTADSATLVSETCFDKDKKWEGKKQTVVELENKNDLDDNM